MRIPCRLNLKFFFLLLTMLISGTACFAQSLTELQLQQMVYSIEGISANEKKELSDQLAVLFRPVTAVESLDRKILTNIAGIISACFFEETSINVIAELAYKSYLAEKNGAPDVFVQDLALIGISTNLTAAQLEMAAKGIQQFWDTGIDPVVTEYFFSYSLYNGWSENTIEQASQGLLRGVRQGLDARRLALTLIISIDQEIQQQPAAQIVTDAINFLTTLKQKAPQESQRQEFAYQEMQQALNNGLPEFVASEIYYTAIKDKWSTELIEVVYAGLLKGTAEGLTPEKLATSIIIRLAQSEQILSPKKLVAEELKFVASLEKKKAQLIRQDEKKFQRQALPTSYRQWQSSLPPRPSPKREESPQYFNATNRSALNQQLLWESIQDYLGPPPTPYRWGGTSKAGIDCSGFTMNIFRQQGIWLPRTSRQQFLVGSAITSILQVGDLVFFSKYGPAYDVTHVGIYIGGDKFVHSSASRGVTVSSLAKGYYRLHYKGARRVI